MNDVDKKIQAIAYTTQIRKWTGESRENLKGRYLPSAVARGMPGHIFVCSLVMAYFAVMLSQGDYEFTRYSALMLLFTMMVIGTFFYALHKTKWAIFHYDLVYADPNEQARMLKERRDSLYKKLQKLAGVNYVHESYFSVCMTVTFGRIPVFLPLFGGVVTNLYVIDKFYHGSMVMDWWTILIMSIGAIGPLYWLVLVCRGFYILSEIRSMRASF